jgi:pimeloyl-ACP methyl ester carboxylesterase
MDLLIAAAAVACLVAGACVRERIAERADRRRFPPPGRIVEVGGRGMHLLIRGEAAGPMVVIEQGLASPSLLWWPVQESAARFGRVCTYDRAGYLWSDSPAGPRSIEDRVADLHKLLSQCGVPPPYVLVGHSFGGLLVQAFARAFPTEVAGLVLVDSPDGPAMFRESSMRFLRQGLAIQGVFRVAAQVGLLRLLGTRVNPMLPEDPAGYALSVTPAQVTAVADDMRCLLNASPGMREPLPAGFLGDRPVLVMTHGVAFPGPAAVLEEGWTEAQQRLKGLSTDSELVVAERCSHMIAFENPALVVEAIRRVQAAVSAGTPLRGGTARPATSLPA